MWINKTKITKVNYNILKQAESSTVHEPVQKQLQKNITHVEISVSSFPMRVSRYDTTHKTILVISDVISLDRQSLTKLYNTTGKYNKYNYTTIHNTYSKLPHILSALTTLSQQMRWTYSTKPSTTQSEFV